MNGWPKWVIREFYHQIQMCPLPWSQAAADQALEAQLSQETPENETKDELESILEEVEYPEPDWLRPAYELKVLERLDQEGALQTLLSTPPTQTSEDWGRKLAESS